MTTTGRIKEPLRESLQKLLLQDSYDEPELRRFADIDRAQILMLCRQGLMHEGPAQQLLDAIANIERSGFVEFRRRHHPRGLYLSWEAFLCEKLGERIGGSIHMGRSRNDIKATALRMKLRNPTLDLIEEITRLIQNLLSIAERTFQVVSVEYTHLRPAMPVTLAHQLAGWSTALSRDALAILNASNDLDRCALGAGAIGGTSFPVDSEYTAELLGFKQPARNSIDAVASRDFVLRLLASAAIAGVTLSRIASELSLMSMDEVGLIRFPDDLVGSSSQMPQKRNPFLVEHGQARAMSALGTFVTSASRMHSTPFSNSVAVGTESVRGLIDAMDDVQTTVVIISNLVEGMEPQVHEMLRVAESTFVTSTEMANRLVRGAGLSFRESHHIVGELTNLALEQGQPLADLFVEFVRKESLNVNVGELDPASVVQASRFGGGPNAKAVAEHVAELSQQQAIIRRDISNRRKRYLDAREILMELCHARVQA